MLNSRDIDLLRADVAQNCRKLVALCAEEGFSVLVTGTVRDAAYQQWCYENGYARSRVPTFHSAKAGLAFDVCQNVKGHEYDDAAFWECAGRIGKQIGFTWGGDWTKFPDKPHFQWDDGGRFSASMIAAGHLPPDMPRFEEDENMTQETFNKLMDHYLDELKQLPPSEWSGDARRWAEEGGLIVGDGDRNRQYRSFVTREQLAVILKRLEERLNLAKK